METQDYHTSFITTVSPQEAFNKILDVSSWWSKHADGKAKKIDDVFTVRFGPNGEKDMYKMQVIEATPGKRLVWKVIDSKQGWVQKTNEWTGTEIIWDIVSEAGGAKISMTQKGLNANLECFQTCQGGWNWLTSESLPKLLQENMGNPV